MTVDNSIKLMIDTAENILFYGSNPQLKVKRWNYTLSICQSDKSGG